MSYMLQEDAQVQLMHRQSERAVKLAMANLWEDAVKANRAILAVFPNDTDSHNRLGKALMELKLSVPGLATLSRVISRLEQLPNVISVRRKG